MIGKKPIANGRESPPLAESGDVSESACAPMRSVPQRLSLSMERRRLPVKKR
ncbi:MAG: hypothetical protein J6B72_01825 [Clostridia bacterium]|nr:hypothetical protein [Clostridia bacterium]